MINNIGNSCEELKLNGILQCYQAISDECIKLQAGYTEYLDQVLKYELSIREQRSKEMLLKVSGFPVLKSLDQFDYSCSNINKVQIQELSTLQFIENRQNVIFIGSLVLVKLI